MNPTTAFIISTIAGLSTLLGSVFIFIKINPININKFISLSLSLSISIMIGISITDLIPTSFFYLLSYSPNYLYIIFIMTVVFIIGIISTILIDKLLSNNTSSLYKLGILSMIALMLHNFPEGIATFMGSMESTELGVKLGVAIMLHNIPEGISISIPIYYSTHSKKKAFISTLLSGLAEPLGAVLSYIFLKNYINNYTISLLLIFVSGLMVSISIEKMFPEAIKHNEYKCVCIGLIIGLFLILINHFIL